MNSALGVKPESRSALAYANDVRWDTFFEALSGEPGVTANAAAVGVCKALPEL